MILLFVDVDGLEASPQVPDGEAKEMVGEPAWVLKGDVSVPLGLQVDPATAVTGSIRFQVCTEGACHPPQDRAWSSDATPP